MPVKAAKREASAATEMEPRIWSKLPRDLLERVLALLPLKSLLNLRCTCKHFNSLLFSPSFLSLTKTPLDSSFLLLSHSQSHPHFPLYDVFLDRWRLLSLPLSHANTPLHLLSSSSGLLLFSLPQSFLICNLLTNTSKTIQFPTYHFSSSTLVSSSSSSSSPPLHGYKIIVLLSSSNSHSNSMFVYDSCAGSWTRFQGYRSILSDNSHHEGVYFEGSLYFMKREPFSIVGFDLKTGAWDTLATETPSELVFARLVSRGSGPEGRLLAVGGVGRDGISRTLKIWELGGGGGEWAEVAVLPGLMCRKFVSVCYHNYEHVYCLLHDGLVCVCCYTWPEILVYKMTRRTWHWLPRCPFLPERWSCGFRWFSFVPDLHALV